MARLPPAAKLPLAARKSVRDDFEEHKSDFEKKLSDLLEVGWTLDIDPLAIYPYAQKDHHKSALGRVIAGYIEGAIHCLGDYKSSYGKSNGIKELNDAAHAHVLGLDVDETGTVEYCGPLFKDGRLVMVFNADKLSTNSDEVLRSKKVLAALNAVPAATGDESLPFDIRMSIRGMYDPKVGDVQERINKTLKRDDIKLVHNFEAALPKLQAYSETPKQRLRNDWRQQVGYTLYNYMYGIRHHLEGHKFGEDEMLREGFNETVPTGIIEFRIVDKLTYRPDCEVVFEDDKMYVQTTVESWGSNTSDAAWKIISQL
ncbi:hypothetical protein F503_05359 [Ophiostoma piceae UAMH 11346]|uniref:Uncharacterized protein n=1 Tax=Ophiostoma piceae (strain UAMH 11346) TaxID=1262450 RepID=S3C9U6_OPHP1|nr:hypothetical protein F503_05359 [Ophiostoma piceae UAMH 11346]